MEGLLYILDIPVVFLTEALGSEVTGTRLFLTLLYGMLISVYQRKPINMEHVVCNTCVYLLHLFIY